MFTLGSFILGFWMAVLAMSSPVPLEMVDMTHVFDETTLNWPTEKKFEMFVTTNQTTEEGYWLQLEEYSSAVHVGTHMDAPCHFALGRWCVDQIPIDRLIAPAAVIDITQKAEEDSNTLVQVEDFQKWENLTGQTLNGTIVLIKSGWGRRWSDWEAFTGSRDNDTEKFRFPAISTKAAQWLVDNRSVYGVGSETLQFDRGSTKKFRVHRILLGANVYGLDNVANMEDIPIYGATLYVLPMKIGNASGAPVRIIATFPKLVFSAMGGKSGTERTLREIIIFNK